MYQEQNTSQLYSSVQLFFFAETAQAMMCCRNVTLPAFLMILSLFPRAFSR